MTHSCRVSHQYFVKQIKMNMQYDGPTKLFINGEFVESKSGKRFKVIQPSTEKTICEVSEADLQDVNDAVDAAEEALSGKWKTMGATGRRDVLLRLADLWEKESEELAKLESFNNGSPINLSMYITKDLVNEWRYNAGWADKIEGRVVQSCKNDLHVYTRREPIGVCGMIVPWNLPLWCLVVKLAPCLAMGNTVVVKPSELTPLTALKLAEMFTRVGLPRGVYNVVPGYGPTAGAAIASHMRIRKVAFTGSTLIGRTVMEAAAKSNLKIVQLELGGKSPMVVFPDVDVEEAVKLSQFAVFNNNGQLCTAGSRTFVHSKIYDEFVQKASKAMSQHVVGDPMDPKNTLGPLINKVQLQKVNKYIQTGKQEGAKLLGGGDEYKGQGYFVNPTVFANVKPDMTIAKEEIFGPVQSIIKFDDEKTVIKLCNESEYGLAAAVLTNDIGTVFRLSSSLQAGTVWVNTYHETLAQGEFGGYKQSGIGREGGPSGVEGWTLCKTVIVKSKL
ncbi:aldehyde dehydrogenase [Acrasis kona]|uniref:Aldehyde dehydrogenase n=1 Tax=Acrasis kona TaxID=1008807 RepID=A0AAW2YYX7_9EUKA